MTGKNDKKTIIPGHLLTSVILADIMALLLHITIKDKGEWFLGNPPRKNEGNSLIFTKNNK